MAGSCCWVSATSFTNDVPAENRDEIIMPARIRDTAWSALDRRLTSQAAATASSPQQNAAAEMPKYPAPSKMATAAPKPAPVEAPRMSGDTMGLRNMP